MLEMVTQLKGFSGCIVYLMRDTHGYFVRKISKSYDYNDRLKTQQIKQKYFHDYFSTPSIKTPEIRDTGYTATGLFYFDMAFIRGIKLPDLVEHTAVSDVASISKVLRTIIGMFRELSLDTEPFDLYEHTSKKVLGIQTTLSARGDLDSEVRDVLNELGEHVKLLRNLERITATHCHGDLTLENIIYDPHTQQYYLIDFLDNYVDHYWFDITKILQDLEGRWLIFRDPTKNTRDTKAKLDALLHDFSSHITTEESIYAEYKDLTLAVNFARILAYAQVEHLPYLLSSIRMCMQNIKKQQT